MDGEAEETEKLPLLLDKLEVERWKGIESR